MKKSSSLHAAAIFSVILGFGSGCSDDTGLASERYAERSTSLSVPVPAFNQFVLLSRRSASFGPRCSVTGGDIGVAADTESVNTLTVNSDSRVGIGQVLLAPRVVLAARSSVGELGADRVSAAPSAVTGPRSPYVSPPAAPLPGAVSAGNVDVSVSSGRSRSLAAGRFAALTVNGTLNLSGGLYEARSLRIGAGGRVVALADTTLRVRNGVAVGERGLLAPRPPLGAHSLRLLIAGTTANDDSLTLGAEARLIALTVAQRNLRGGDRTVVMGAMAAQSVSFGRDARITFDDGFECSSDTDCDDSSPCSVDSCVDTRCSHSFSPDGSACDDGDPCSLGDRCQAGQCRAGTDLAVTELDSGLSQPRSIVAGPDGDLWFVAPETQPGAADGSLARVTTAGVVTRTYVSRQLGALLAGPDARFWVSERLVGGLPALGRYDSPSRRFVADFTGMIAHDLAGSNDSGQPIIWFTGGSSVGRITPTGELLQAVPTFYATRAITAATPNPATVLWLTEANGGGFSLIGRLDFPRLQQFSVSTPGELVDIVEGPDSGIWFTDPAQNELGRMPAAGGSAVKFALPTPASGPHSIVAGPDGNLWVSLRSIGKLARVTPRGAVTEVCLPSASSEPTELAVGADGNIWFTESGSGKLGRVQLGP